VGEFVPGYETSIVLGVGVPKATPVEIIDKLNREINAALADPKLKERLAVLGGTPLAGSPADFAKLIAEETEKWGKVIKFAGIKPERTRYSIKPVPRTAMCPAACRPTARFRTIQVSPKDPRALPGHPESAVSWPGGFRGGAHARPKATPVPHAAWRCSSGMAARDARSVDHA
jgi:Tripartite tricarboxylate transporter family receptor